MASNQTYGQVFYVTATADALGEDAYNWGTGAKIGGTVNETVPRVRKVTLANDGSVALLYRLGSSSEIQKSLAASATITHDVISPSLWVETGSSTAVFRAWGEG
jgi:hypothetical protein